MALVSTTTSVTLDETTGLQNDYWTDVAGDSDDNDIAADQLPAEFLARLVALGASTPTQVALSGYTGAAGDTGANAITYTAIGGSADVYFSDASGKPLDGTDSGLTTVDGQAIFLYTDTESNNILLGKTAGGALAFSAFLQETSSGETGAKIWMVQYGALFNPIATNPDDPVNLIDLVHVTVAQDQSFSLENAPSGQNLFVMFGTSEVALVVTGKMPANQSEGFSINTGDTVNTSFAAGSTTIGINNQMVNPGEGVYYTFVTGANSNFTVPNLSETEADLESNISFTGLYTADSARFSVVQLQGGTLATLKLTAINTALETGVNFIDGLGDLDDVAVSISSVLVRNAIGEDVTSSLTVTNTSGVITISGIQAGYTVDYTTTAAHNRVLIENVGGTGGADANFDLGGFLLTNAVTEKVEVGSKMVFEDDGPSITLATPTDTVILNTHDALTIGTAFDTDSKSFAEAFGVASRDYGADGAGSTADAWAYGLSITSQGIDSGLATNSSTIRLFQLASGTVVGSTASDLASVSADNTVFDIAVNTAGVVTLHQYIQVNHPIPGDNANYDSQTVALANGLVTLTASATVTDFDSDTDADFKTLDLGGNIVFSDHGPNAAAISDLSGPNVADPIYGTYDFSIGADVVNNDEATGIVLQSLTGATAFSSTTPLGRAITNTSVTWESETDTQVHYSFDFQYHAGPDSDTLRDGSGTIVFDKTNGTFVFDVDAPLVGETTYSTSTPAKSFNYDTLGNKSPEIVVQKYADNFFGVLTGQASNPPSKTATLVAGSDHSYAPGELLSNAFTGYVNVATDTLGVNSDTIQAGELLNYDFYAANPVAGSTSPPQRPGATIDTSTQRAYVDEVAITLSQLNADEDIVVLLKLWNPDTQSGTTKLLLADSASDYATVGAYKVVHIDQNDYDSANYDIYGLQVLSSTEMIQGTGYRLSDGTAKTLGSAGTGYQDSADLDVFKIIKIDVTTEETTHYDADLVFSGQVIDHDADYAGFSFKVHLEADGLPPFEVLTQALAPTPDPLAM